MNKSLTESLSGDLTVREVPAAWSRLTATLPGEIDLAGVQRADSSALALLLECKALATNRGQPIAFHNPPENLRVIARLTEVDELLGWTRTTENKDTGH